MKQRTEDPSVALAALSRAIDEVEQAPQDPEAWVALSKARRALRQPDVQPDPRDAARLSALGLPADHAGAAGCAALEALSLDPSSPSAWFRMGLGLGDGVGDGQGAEAVAEARRVVAQLPRDPRSAEAYAKAQAVALDPTFVVGWEGLANTLNRARDQSDGEAILDAARKVRPELPAELSRAFAYAYAQALRLDPSYANAWRGLGIALTNVLVDAEAEAILEAARQPVPSIPQNHHEAATYAAAQAVCLAPAEAMNWDLLGLALAGARDACEAELALPHALAVLPQLPADVWLADTYAHASSIELDDGNPRVWTNLGEALRSAYVAGHGEPAHEVAASVLHELPSEVFRAMGHAHGRALALKSDHPTGWADLAAAGSVANAAGVGDLVLDAARALLPSLPSSDHVAVVYAAARAVACAADRAPGWINLGAGLSEARKAERGPEALQAARVWVAGLPASFLVAECVANARAAALAPSLAMAWLNLALSLREVHRQHVQVEAVTAARRIIPELAPSAFRAEALVWARGIALDRSNAPAWSDLGGTLAEAIQARRGPTATEAARGQLAELPADPAVAATLCQIRALTIDPDRPSAWRELGASLRLAALASPEHDALDVARDRLGSLPSDTLTAAAHAGAAALALDPEDPHSWLSLGLTLDDAVQGPRRDEVLAEVGRALPAFSYRPENAAVQAILRALQLDGANARTWGNLGGTLLRAASGGRLEVVAPLVRRSLPSVPEEPLRCLGRVLTKGIRLDPREAWMWINLQRALVWARGRGAASEFVTVVRETLPELPAGPGEAEVSCAARAIALDETWGDAWRMLGGSLSFAANSLTALDSALVVARGCGPPTSTLPAPGWPAALARAVAEGFWTADLQSRLADSLSDGEAAADSRIEHGLRWGLRLPDDITGDSLTATIALFPALVGADGDVVWGWLDRGLPALLGRPDLLRSTAERLGRADVQLAPPVVPHPDAEVGLVDLPLDDRTPDATVLAWWVSLGLARHSRRLEPFDELLQLLDCLERGTGIRSRSPMIHAASAGRERLGARVGWDRLPLVLAEMRRRTLLAFAVACSLDEEVVFDERIRKETADSDSTRQGASIRPATPRRMAINWLMAARRARESGSEADVEAAIRQLRSVAGSPGVCAPNSLGAGIAATRNPGGSLTDRSWAVTLVGATVALDWPASHLDRAASVLREVLVVQGSPARWRLLATAILDGFGERQTSAHRRALRTTAQLLGRALAVRREGVPGPGERSDLARLTAELGAARDEWRYHPEMDDIMASLADVTRQLIGRLVAPGAASTPLDGEAWFAELPKEVRRAVGAAWLYASRAGSADPDDPEALGFGPAAVLLLQALEQAAWDAMGVAVMKLARIATTHADELRQALASPRQTEPVPRLLRAAQLMVSQGGPSLGTLADFAIAAVDSTRDRRWGPPGAEVDLACRAALGLVVGPAAHSLAGPGGAESARRLRSIAPLRNRAAHWRRIGAGPLTDREFGEIARQVLTGQDPLLRLVAPNHRGERA